VESIHLAVAHWVVDDVRARINRRGRHSEPPAAATQA
jgi:hypothetical protein